MSVWNAEQRLICDLLDNYQVKWGRPVRNMSEDVEVRFGLQLIHISDLVHHINKGKIMINEFVFRTRKIKY